MAESSFDEPTGESASAHRPLMKGRQTRAAILDAALALASQMGLEGLSIGALDKQIGRAHV